MWRPISDATFNKFVGKAYREHWLAALKKSELKDLHARLGAGKTPLPNSRRSFLVFQSDQHGAFDDNQLGSIMRSSAKNIRTNYRHSTSLQRHTSDFEMIKKICTTHAMTHASGAGSASDVDEKSTTDRHAKIPPAEDTWQPAHTSGESDSLELQVDTGTRVAAAAVMSGAALVPRMDDIQSDERPTKKQLLKTN